MLKALRFAVLVSASLVLAGPLQAATPDQEKAFVDGYKKAFEAKDAAALKALLYTKGADPMAVEFYGQMMTSDFAGTMTEITLEALTPEDVKKAAAVMPGPTGGKFVLLPKAYKKLVVKVETKDASGKSTMTNTSFVAEADGKLVIATPSPAK